MIKKLFNLIKKGTEVKKEGNNNNKVEEENIKDIVKEEKLNENINTISIEEETYINENKNEEKNDKEDFQQQKDIEDIEIEDKNIDKEFILNAKIKRGKSIKAIDIYTGEEQIFDTYRECSKKLKVPEDYIVENLKFGYTDYLGEAIKYLSKELRVSEYSNYLEGNKSSLEIFNNLHDKIFTAKISEIKRDDILANEKIEPIKMHYKFECIDYEYDEYFEKYKSIIKRGGKKKVELVNKKGEVIDIFKSLEECSIHLNKDKREVTEMLKYKDTKVGRYEIRYSLRNI